MSKNIPIGVDDFAELLNKENNYLFVDKTLFIKSIIDDKSKVTLITRPRRWGKTLNLSMLQHFLAKRISGKSTEKLFEGLFIRKIDGGRYQAEQGKYPVIFITLKEVKQKDFAGMVNMLKELINETYDQHKYLLDSKELGNETKDKYKAYLSGDINQQQIETSLRFLSRCLNEHHKETVYILIDEYDAPLNQAYQKGYLSDASSMMRNFFSSALKGNPYLKKGVMTGILWISKNSMLSGLNNVESFSALNDETYKTHFGFSEDEVKSVFSQCSVDYANETKHYYNGYNINDCFLYNPWSIMKCLKQKGELMPYWVNTADDDLLKNILVQSSVEIKQELQKLISDDNHTIKTVVTEMVRFDNICENPITLWSLLLATGYLTAISRKPFNLNYECILTIPNEEVKQLYINVFQSWLFERLNSSQYYAFLADLLSGKIDSFTQKLEKYLLTYGSYHDFPNESNYHTFMLGLLCGLTTDYALFSNPEAGEGRADILLIPKDSTKDFAIIMELKHANKRPTKKLVQNALTQIDIKDYAAFINRYPTLKKLLKIGLGFHKKKVACSYVWSELPRD